MRAGEMFGRFRTVQLPPIRLGRMSVLKICLIKKPAWLSGRFGWSQFQNPALHSHTAVNGYFEIEN